MWVKEERESLKGKDIENKGVDRKRDRRGDGDKKDKGKEKLPESDGGSVGVSSSFKINFSIAKPSEDKTEWIVLLQKWFVDEIWTSLFSVFQ